MVRTRLKTPVIALWLACTTAFAADTALTATSEAELVRQASLSAYAAWDVRDVDTLLTLAQRMKALACARNDAVVCRNLEVFETAQAPSLKPGKTLLMGPVSMGTAMRDESFGACVFDNQGTDTLGTCFGFGPGNEAQRRDIETILQQQQAGAVDETLSIFRFLNAQFQGAPALAKVQTSAKTAVVYRPEEKPDDADAVRKPLPTLLRQQGDTVYAASVGFLGRPGSFDSYPTLMLSTLKMLK